MPPLINLTSRYQHILLDGTPTRYRLWLDGYFQFDSGTEAQYHQLLANLPMTLTDRTRRVLIMGGGDGLAAREALKYPVESVVNIELDPAMIALAKMPPVSNLNRGAFSDPRVKVIQDNAEKWLGSAELGMFDVVIADFPAATNLALERLYTDGFYGQLRPFVAPGGIFVTQVSENGRTTHNIRNRLGALYGNAVTVVARTLDKFEEKFVYASDLPLSPNRALVDAPLAKPAWTWFGNRTKPCLVMDRNRR